MRLSLGIGTVCLAAAGMVSSFPAVAQPTQPAPPAPPARQAQAVIVQRMGGGYLGIGAMEMTS
jgi:hypothetical protein